MFSRKNMAKMGEQARIAAAEGFRRQGQSGAAGMGGQSLLAKGVATHIMSGKPLNKVFAGARPSQFV